MIGEAADEDGTDILLIELIDELADNGNQVILLTELVGETLGEDYIDALLTKLISEAEKDADVETLLAAPPLMGVELDAELDEAAHKGVDDKTEDDGAEAMLAVVMESA